MTYKVCLACGNVKHDDELKAEIEAETIRKKLEHYEQLKRENVILSAKVKGFDILFFEDGKWEGEPK